MTTFAMKQFYLLLTSALGLMAAVTMGENKLSSDVDSELSGGDAPVDLRDVTWISIQLSDVRVSYAAPSYCVKYKFVYTSPMIRLELTDSDGQTRFQLWKLPDVQADERSFTSLPDGSRRFLTYFYRNATMATSLIGHNSQFVDPKRKPEILESSSPVDLLQALSAGRANVSGTCYNASAVLTRLDPMDFVPTTTSGGADQGEPAYLEAGGPLIQSFRDGSLNAPAPLWLVVLAGSLLCCMLAAFCVLCVAHVRTRRRHRHCAHHRQLKAPVVALDSPGDTIKTADRRTGFRYVSGTVPLPSHCNGNSSHTTSASSCCTAPPVPAPNYPTGRRTGGQQQQHPPPGAHRPVMVESVVRAAAGSDEEESHYDVPWEHRWRPLPEWLRSDLATSLAYSNGQANAGGGDVPTVTPVPVRPPSMPPYGGPHLQQQHQHQQRHGHKMPTYAVEPDDMRLCA